MLFWSIAIAIAAIVSVALFYAGARQPVNANATPGADATTTHHRLQLREIEADLAAGRLGVAEAELARAELAREVLRLKGDARPKRFEMGRLPVIPIASVAVVALAFVVYAGVGTPTLPSQPLAGRGKEVAAANLNVNAAIEAIETHLREQPDDLRGWQVIAPVYMQTQRFDEAETAFRRILALAPPTADAETDLAESLILKAQGDVGAEARALLESAAARDPQHLRSRFYLAGQATQAGEFDRAKVLWSEIIAMGKGDESWMAAARNGLAMAENGGKAPAETAAPDPAAMVARLAGRLTSAGGTIDEWTRLVRSYVVLGQTEKAQEAYDMALAAYPDTKLRTELDALAKESGLALGRSAQ